MHWHRNTYIRSYVHIYTHTHLLAYTLRYDCASSQKSLALKSYSHLWETERDPVSTGLRDIVVRSGAGVVRCAISRKLIDKREKPYHRVTRRPRRRILRGSYIKATVLPSTCRSACRLWLVMYRVRRTSGGKLSEGPERNKHVVITCYGAWQTGNDQRKGEDEERCHLIHLETILHHQHHHQQKNEESTV